MPSRFEAFIPTDKDEVAKARKLIAMGYPAVLPVLPEIFEWVEDANWPVARIFLPFLAGIGAPLAAQVRYVLQSQDEQWKQVVLTHVVAPSEALAHALTVDLHRLIHAPTAGESAEGLDTMANTLFGEFCGGKPHHS